MNLNAFNKSIEWMNKPDVDFKIDQTTVEALETLSAYGTKEMRYNVLFGILRNVAMSAFQDAYNMGYREASESAYEASRIYEAAREERNGAIN